MCLVIISACTMPASAARLDEQHEAAGTGAFRETLPFLDQRRPELLLEHLLVDGPACSLHEHVSPFVKQGEAYVDIANARSVEQTWQT